MAHSFPIIDADAHVIETERTWDYLDESDRNYRPRLYSTPNDPMRQYWVLEDKIAGFRFLTLSERELQDFAERAGRNFATPQAARELDDVELRLKHMDELGIDIQVLHNTFWIEQVTTKPQAEVAVCRSWNRWLADISKQSHGRLFYSCVVPGHGHRRSDRRNQIRQGQRRRGRVHAAPRRRPPSLRSLLLSDLSSRQRSRLSDRRAYRQRQSGKRRSLPPGACGPLRPIPCADRHRLLSTSS